MDQISWLSTRLSNSKALGFTFVLLKAGAQKSKQTGRRRKYFIVLIYYKIRPMMKRTIVPIFRSTAMQAGTHPKSSLYTVIQPSTC
ncbi:hypothetical protein HW115_09770 [Verrucomicrobiaceae bacterium N1E253]|uniref:Uncharacterized protein n=1 Tax=Oceaniferula marina TaxID=2748318 RepID=A0A851GFC2_9BACT|nr:hypothetical protein [Oceaniferula marina]